MAKILVIDDDNGVREVIVMTLEAAGHTVDEARDGREGVARFKANPPDLVITDIIMPDKEGIEVIRDLKALVPDVRIIAMSGGGRTGNMDFLDIAKEFGATHILHKPFRPQEMLKIVAQVLG